MMEERGQGKRGETYLLGSFFCFKRRDEINSTALTTEQEESRKK